MNISISFLFTSVILNFEMISTIAATIPRLDVKVAIIGGGIAGLSCSNHLKLLGIENSVYDTGKRFVGGRCSSRIVNIDGRPVILDHSAQFIPIRDQSDPIFKDYITAQAASGVLHY